MWHTKTKCDETGRSPEPEEKLPPFPYLLSDQDQALALDISSKIMVDTTFFTNSPGYRSSRELSPSMSSRHSKSHPTYPYPRKGSGKVFDPSTDSQYGFLEIKFRKKGNIRASRC
ncbi:hypothetical protein pdam_00004630 [Pocillopora damicornis]|uniref:Uncharacterized protein n=1 Tax=Pocillopora damicornis TaxID=46731 RepID=A0A3M6ULH1_POCDA|nr:hypothetical protein pdam_00004630 [Pocillopora damicornis]